MTLLHPRTSCLLIAVLAAGCSALTSGLPASLRSFPIEARTSLGVDAAAVAPSSASARVAIETLPDGSTRMELRSFVRHRVQQETDVWCWAACAQMVHAWYGRALAQDEIVRRIQGETAASPDQRVAATEREVALALEPSAEARTQAEFQESLGTAASAVTQYVQGRTEWHEVVGPLARAAFDARDRFGNLSTNPDSALEDLRAGHPIVVGLRIDAPGDGPTGLGHACVLYGVRCTLPASDGADVSGGNRWIGTAAPRVHEFLLVDPWTGAESTLARGEFESRVDFYASLPGIQRRLRSSSRGGESAR